MLKDFEYKPPTREEILDAERELKLLRQQRDRELETNKGYEQEEVSALRKAYYEIERAIERRHDEGQNDRNEISNKFSIKMSPASELLGKKKFLLKCKHISMKEWPGTSKINFTVTNGYNETKEEIKSFSTLYVDNHMRLEAYIVPNDRPKNRWSLAIVGNSRILELMSQRPYGYGYRWNTEDANIKTEVKHATEELDLVNYYQSNKHKILKDFIDEHLELVPKYETAVKATDNQEWTRLYLEDRKYYYEHHYCRGTETPEYLEIIRKMATLGFLEDEEEPKQKKFYFPVKLVGKGKDEEEAWADAVDGFNSDPGVMDEFEEADEDNEEY